MEISPADKKILDAIHVELADPETVGERREELREALEYYSHKYCFDWLVEDDEEGGGAVGP